MLRQLSTATATIGLLMGPAVANADPLEIAVDAYNAAPQAQNHPAALARARELGATWLRFQIHSQFWPSRAQQYLDGVRDARAAGFSVYVSLSPFKEYGMRPAQYGRWAASVSRTLGPYVARWQTQNEPDNTWWTTVQPSDCSTRREVMTHVYGFRKGRRHVIEWHSQILDPCTRPRALAARANYIAAYRAIHREDPTAQVIGGGMDSSGEDAAFARIELGIDGKGKRVLPPIPMDGFAQHPYVRRGDPLLTTENWRANHPKGQRYLAAILDQAWKAGAIRSKARPHIYADEWGYMTHGANAWASDAASASYVARALKYLCQTPTVSFIAFYSLRAPRQR